MKQNDNRRIIIDGNTVYELDRDCILKKRADAKQDGDKYTNRNKDNNTK